MFWNYLGKFSQGSSPKTGGIDLDLTCRSRGSETPPDWTGQVSGQGVSGQTPVRTGLRSGVPETWTWDLRPYRSIFGRVFFLFSSVWHGGSLGQKRGPSPDEVEGIVDDDENDESPTDVPDVWLTGKNEEDTMFERVSKDDIPTKRNPQSVCAEPTDCPTTEKVSQRTGQDFYFEQ